MPKKLVKLVKLKNSDSALILDHIEVGFELTGYLEQDPVVGEHIFIYNESGHTNFTSSLIIGVLPNNTYKTINSIYQIVDLIAHRDCLINSIFE